MVEKQLTCLIVGETPATQFLSWRLSLGNSFLILVSQYVPSDGLVGWKSSRLGANFYTPNIFTKDVKELSSRLLHATDKVCKYSIDIMIISGISIDSLEANCLELSKYVTRETCVLISADFGCELEIIASKAIGDKCRCILSVSCDVECRQLSLGSYALVNDDNCRIIFGVTYSSKKHGNDPVLLENETKFQNELTQKKSKLNLMIQQLVATPWIKVKKFNDSKQMATKMWEFIIPKISLNILSIIYEQFDYDLMLQDKNTETMFRDLVRELFEICIAQCNSEVEEYLLRQGNNPDQINYDGIIEHCKRKKLELIMSTAHEYPEYLSLPFEPYCFYHRFEYPAQILLYQPILLAKKYNVACSNLNFLYGFYSRLLSLSGLSIEGGRIERNTSQFDHLLSSSAEAVNESSSDERESNKNIKKPNFDYSNFGFSMSLPTGTNKSLPKDVKTQYINGAGVPPDTNAFHAETHCIRVNDSSSEDEQNDSKESLALSKGSIFNISHENLYRKTKSQEQLEENRSHSSSDNNQLPPTSQSILDDMGIMSAQQYDKITSQNPFSKSQMSLLYDHYHLRGAYSTSDSLRRPFTTTGLELQLRNGHNLIVKEYQDLQNKLYNFEKSRGEEESYERRMKYAYMENQLWKFQRRLNIYNGKIPRPNSGPYEALLDHIEILTHNSPIDVLKCTTGRYTGVDLYTSIEADRERIKKLKNVTFTEDKHQKQGKQGKQGRHTIMSFPEKKNISSSDLHKPSSTS